MLRLPRNDYEAFEPFVEQLSNSQQLNPNEISAILVQSRGSALTKECRACENNRGPFVHCIAISGQNEECGNCVWNGQLCDVSD